MRFRFVDRSEFQFIVDDQSDPGTIKLGGFRARFERRCLARFDTPLEGTRGNVDLEVRANVFGPIERNVGRLFLEIACADQER